MYDMHYDLLTILYFNMTKNNQFSNMEKLLKDCSKIYNHNIQGGIINLYFMTPEEMQEEIGISITEMKNIKDMFLKSIRYLNDLKKLNIIPDNIDFIYSIEGCDYVKIEDLEELYNYGLRSILPVWNHNNQYGSGNRTQNGLTKQGIDLIKKSIELGIIIDTSHANMPTFNDILTVISQEKENNPIVMASHSNIRTLCDRDRNLSDEQLIKLRDIGGYIGLFTNGNFLSKGNEQLAYVDREKQFLKHLDYLIHTIKFDINKIFVSTDDMNFNPDISYHHLEAFPIENISKRMFEVVSNQYGTEIADKIMIQNSQNLIQKVKVKTNGKSK